MLINANTKIGALLRQQPAALEAIVSISPKFSKLRNPLLRNLIADKASIAMASKMGGCSVEDFYNKLQPLGFEIQRETSSGQPEPGKEIKQGWQEAMNRFEGKIETLDVRDLEMPLPMHAILQALDKLDVGKALFVYHKRIPVFLLPELEERKFSYRIREISEQEVNLLIYRD